jgi:hypothetical protein
MNQTLELFENADTLESIRVEDAEVEFVHAF